MKKYNFNKLIRSKLPGRMKEEGVVISGRTLENQEFIIELKNKLVEEALEVKDTSSRQELIKELADVVETIEALISSAAISREEIEEERRLKSDTNGVFLPENFVDYIEVPRDKLEIIEYLENKNRPYDYRSK